MSIEETALHLLIESKMNAISMAIDYKLEQLHFEKNKDNDSVMWYYIGANRILLDMFCALHGQVDALDKFIEDNGLMVKK